MKKVEINIPFVSFPNQFVTDAEKSSPEFGLQIETPLLTSGLEKTGIKVDITVNGETSIGCAYMRAVSNLLANTKTNWPLTETYLT